MLLPWVLSLSLMHKLLLIMLSVLAPVFSLVSFPFNAKENGVSRSALASAGHSGVLLVLADSILGLGVRKTSKAVHSFISMPCCLKCLLILEVEVDPSFSVHLL